METGPLKALSLERVGTRLEPLVWRSVSREESVKIITNLKTLMVFLSDNYLPKKSFSYQMNKAVLSET